jgi:hypothetical protein
VVCLGPLGFENAYALAMRARPAELYGIRTVADLAAHAPRWKIAGDLQFFGRREWAEVREKYGLAFRQTRPMDPTLMYEAVSQGSVDVVSAYTSDGRITAFDLVVLEDPRRAFPPYDAVLLVSAKAAARPDLVEALRPLVGAIPVEEMRKANRRVDVEHQTVHRAARELRKRAGSRARGRPTPVTPTSKERSWRPCRAVGRGTAPARYRLVEVNQGGRRWGLGPGAPAFRPGIWPGSIDDAGRTPKVTGVVPVDDRLPWRRDRRPRARSRPIVPRPDGTVGRGGRVRRRSSSASRDQDVYSSAPASRRDRCGAGGAGDLLLMARAGLRVTIVERMPGIGGRTSAIDEDGFRFDLGSTILSYPRALRSILSAVGRDLDADVPMVRLDPMYRLVFGAGGDLLARTDPRLLARDVARLSPDDAPNVRRFLDANRAKFARLRPVMESPFRGWRDVARFVLSPSMPRTVMHVRPWRSLEGELARYFRDPRLRIAFSFQSKYLGMSPASCPSLFSILAFLEHEYGIYHPIGGCSSITSTWPRSPRRWA